MKKLLVSFATLAILLFGASVFGQPPPCTPGIQFNGSLGESYCIIVCPGAVTTICVQPHSAGLYPAIFMLPGCSPDNTRCNFECPFNPTGIYWIYDPTAWTWDATGTLLCNTIMGTDFGCLCLTFEGWLAAEMGSFDAIAGNGSVQLNWNTSSETHLQAFEIMRSVAGGDEQQIGTVDATNNQSGAQYSFTDHDVINGSRYTYSLTLLNTDGSRTITGLSVEATPSGNLASDFALEQNYPNPFNPTTEIRFSLRDAATIELAVFDLNGRQVATLVKGELAAGAHQVQFDANDLPSGIYFYRLTAPNFTATHSMLLLK